MLFFMFISLNAAVEKEHKHILILHSYNQSMSWVQSINRAIEDTLKPIQNDYILHIENMDTKRTYNREYLEKLTQIYKIKYKDTQFDLILSSDNHAFEYLKERRDSLFANTPVIFGGVNFFKDSDLAGVKNFTGVAEEIDAKGSIRVARRLYPELKNIFVINDYLTTGRAWEHSIKEQLESIKDDINITYAQNLSIGELQKRIASLSRDTIILLGVYFKDKNQEYFTYEKIGERIAKESKVPIFTLLKFNLNHGVVGGSLIDGYSVGKAMSKMAKKLLEGRDISELKVVRDKGTEYYFDYKALKKFNMPLSALPKDAIVLNTPNSFYAKNRSTIFIGVATLLVLLLLIALLVIRNKKIKRVAQEVQERFYMLFMDVPIALVYIKKSGELLRMNNSFATSFGYSFDEVATMAQWSIYAYPEREYRERVNREWEQSIQKALKTGEDIAPMFHNVTCKDGTLKSIQVSGRVIGDDILVTLIDLTEHFRVENLLRANNEKLLGLFKLSPLGIVLTTFDGMFVEFNDAFRSICGYSEEELYRLDYWRLTPKRYADEEQKQLNSLEQKGSYGPYEKEYIKKDGSLVPISLNGMIITNSKGERLIWSIVENISQRRDSEKMLKHLAHYDSLTNLPNRVLFSDRMHQAMLRSHRVQSKIVILYLDLDGFKEVNDNYGHDIGDELLIVIATRMKRMLRRDDSIARVGGDEFVILLNDFENYQLSIEIIERLLSSIAAPTTIKEQSLRVSASVGMTIYPQLQELDADQLLRQADQAMYQAKISGKNRYSIFAPQEDRSIRGHHEILEQIRLALEHNEFELYYQPKVNLRTGEVIGAEALIRWNHPTRGVLAPSYFLADIEGSYLELLLGEWVINRALEQIDSFLRENIDIKVSINISAAHIQQRDFIEKFRASLAKYPLISLSNVELEILETTSIENMAEVSSRVKELSALGVELSLDDFGTGYSSLTYLKHLCVSTIKIDQSFVRDMLEDLEDFAIVDGVIGLANAFNRNVIAEGMEQIEHGVLLLKLGCELAQGYAIARPMPAHEIAKWIGEWRADKSWRDVEIVDSSKLPILYAMIEHKSWIKKLIASLSSHDRRDMQMGKDSCRFSKWLHNHSFEESAIEEELITLHDEVHQVANELLRLDDYDEVVQEKIDSLYLLRDRLLKVMELLLKQ